jgi:hypothetical protein
MPDNPIINPPEGFLAPPDSARSRTGRIERVSGPAGAIPEPRIVPPAPAPDRAAVVAAYFDDPAAADDPHCWALAFTDGIIAGPDGEAYVHPPGPHTDPEPWPDA